MAQTKVIKSPSKKTPPKKTPSKKIPAKKTLAKKTSKPKKSAPKKTTAPKSQSSLRRFIGQPPAKNLKGKFLVLIDDTTESLTALRFAAISAKRLGSNMTLLMALEPDTHRHWAGVESIMKEEARQEAMEKMRELAKEITDYAQITPDITIREGSKFQSIVKLVEEDPHISALVIGEAETETASTSGPLISAVLSGELAKLGLPLIIVPENITDTLLRRIARIM